MFPFGCFFRGNNCGFWSQCIKVRVAESVGFSFVLLGLNYLSRKVFTIPILLVFIQTMVAEKNHTITCWCAVYCIIISNKIKKLLLHQSNAQYFNTFIVSEDLASWRTKYSNNYYKCLLLDWFSEQIVSIHFHDISITIYDINITMT